jgi:DNA-binding NarL/FixJ family response regulator
VLDHADVYRAARLRADCHQGAARCLLALGDQPGALDQARAAALLERWPGWRRDEAAALLAEGLSNGEIARRLFISAKTASVHVSNILAKLGMASRAEVAAWAARSGLVPGAAP